jgi:hypothetical protein
MPAAPKQDQALEACRPGYHTLIRAEIAGESKPNASHPRDEFQAQGRYGMKN